MQERSGSKRREAIGPQIMPKQLSLFDRGSEIGERFEKRVGDAYADFLKEALPYAYDVLHARAWEADELPFECRREEGLALQDYLEAAFGARASAATARQQAAIVSMLVLDKVNYREVVGIHFRSLLTLSNYSAQLSSSTRVELIVKARGSTVETFSALVESTASGRRAEPKRRKELTGNESSIKTIEHFDHETTQHGDARPLGDKLAEVANQKLNEPGDRTQLRIFAVGLDKPERQELYALWVAHEQRTHSSMVGLDFWQMLDRTLLGRLRRDSRDGELDPDEETAFKQLEEKLS
jgi:hypothetical protein